MLKVSYCHKNPTYNKVNEFFKESQILTLYSPNNFYRTNTALFPIYKICLDNFLTHIFGF